MVTPPDLLERAERLIARHGRVRVYCGMHAFASTPYPALLVEFRQKYPFGIITDTRGEVLARWDETPDKRHHDDATPGSKPVQDAPEDARQNTYQEAIR